MQGPLEFKDFAGGITDNIILGENNRSQIIDNYFITTDHKLEMRYAFMQLDNTNYQLPVTGYRINGMYSFVNESIIMAQTSRHLYYLSSIDTPTRVWTEIVGPSSNEAIQGGDTTSQNSFAEFQKIIYITNDGQDGSQGILPSKIFRDSTNTWVARTAGLPRSYSTGTMTLNSLLGQLCALANALQISFLAHFNDAGGPAGGSGLHALADTVDYNALNATPTATTQASLFTLIGALNTALSNHTADANIGGRGTAGIANNVVAIPVYHWDLTNTTASIYNGASSNMLPGGPLTTASGYQLYIPVKGPNVAPTNNSTPTIVSSPTDTQTLAVYTTCAAQLDDLYQKFNWHRLAVWTHSFWNDIAIIDKYKPTIGKIGRVQIGNTWPTITPDYSDFYNFVNNLKTMMNSHFNSTSTASGHTSGIPAFMRINPVNATDIDGAFLLIFWMRAQYDLHVNDALTPVYTNTTVTSSSGLVGLTAVTQAAASVNVSGHFFSLSTAAMFVKQGATPVEPVGLGLDAYITGSGTGTANADRFAAGTHTYNGQISLSLFHSSFTSNAYTTVTTSPVQTSEILATLPYSLGTASSGVNSGSNYDITSWITLASELFFCLYSHWSNVNSHNQTVSGYFTFFNSISQQCPSFFIPSIDIAAYAFFWSDDYFVESNGLEYLILSNPVFTDSLQLATSYPVGTNIISQNVIVYPSVTIATTRSNVISNIPVLVNTNSTNYATTNIYFNIYKTLTGGTTYYNVNKVLNTTTSYTDSASDNYSTSGVNALSTNQQLYTTGGNVGYDQAPISKFIEIVNGTAYYGFITDTGQVFPQRIRQSLPNAPDHCPSTFFDDLDDEITGLARARSALVVFCRNSIYRSGGGFNNLGQGALTHERISDVIGALNQKGIVKTEVGVFFAGNDGFYYTDGYQIIKLSLEIDKTYQSFTATKNQTRAIIGAYDKIKRRIHWSIKSSDNSTDNDKTYVFYLDFGIKPSGVFSTISNTQSVVDAADAATTPIYSPTSMVFQNGVCYYGHSKGYVLISDNLNKSDARIDPSAAASAWRTVYIPFNWTSCAIDCGSIYNRKYFTKLHILGKNEGNVEAQINIIRDLNYDGDGIKPMSIINYKDNIVWGNPSCLWNDPTLGKTQVWNPVGRYDLWRRFPKTTLRADLVQIQMVPALAAIYSSSGDYPVGCNAQIDATLKTATILTPSGYSAITWPLDVIDYYISFQTDSYVNQYLITNLTVSNTVITFSDATNLSVTNASGLPWVIRGYKKNQRPNHYGIVVHFEFMGDKTQAYPGGNTGSGAGNGGENPS